jgi:hypothetical protein
VVVGIARVRVLIRHSLEKELLALQPLQSRRVTREQVANYIDNYCDLVRLHSYLDDVSHIEFETNEST